MNYTAESIRGLQFIAVPLKLLQEEIYADLTDSDILIYSLLRDRLKLSERNGWEDEHGVYLYYKQAELAKLMRRSERTLRRSFASLRDHGLITSVQQGVGRPLKIYVTDMFCPDRNAKPDRTKMTYGPDKNDRSERTKMAGPFIDESTEKNQQSITKETIKAPADKSVTVFRKPTLEEVQGYIQSHGYHFSAEAFMASNESKGWMVGRTKMKSWKAACRTWELNELKWKKEKKAGRNGNDILDAFRRANERTDTTAESDICYDSDL